MYISIHHYDLRLVGLSILIAVLSAYNALDLAGRITVAQRKIRWGWLWSGAVTMGIGIWAMHFIGMLAAYLPISVSYDWLIVGLSIVPAVFASAIALNLVSQAQVKPSHFVLGSIFMGLGIATMHYSGMAAMKIPASIVYDVTLVVASIAIAICVSGVALVLAFQLRESTSPNWALRRLGSGMVMGLAIPIMHYTGMAAISFTNMTESPAPSFDRGILAIAIGLGSGLILSLTLLTAFLDRIQAQRIAQTLKELQQTQSQLIQTEKMSSLGQLVAGIAHEINNPLNFVSANILPAIEYIESLTTLIRLYQKHYPQPVSEVQMTVEQLDLDFMLKDFENLILSMQTGADRIREIVLSLRNFSRLDETGVKPIDIHQGIENSLLLLRHRLQANGSLPQILIQKHYEDTLPLVDCNAGQLNQVFISILSNAIDAVRESDSSHPMILITTQQVNDRVWISIKDNGEGIPAAIRDRIFDPFFTTKPVGAGAGLGLSISYQIIKEHQGSLTCTSAPKQGTTLQIELPIRA